MPTLPTYTSQRNITANIAEPVRQEVAIPFENIRTITGAAKDVTQAWSDAKDVMDYTKAKTELETALSIQVNKAKDDPNPDNVTQHLKELERIKNEATKGISNNLIAQKAKFEFDHAVNLTAIDIDTEFKKKSLLNNELYLSNLSQTMAEKKSNATGALKTQVDADFYNIIQENVSKGNITPHRGTQLIDDYRLGEVDLDIMNDLSSTAESSFVLNELRKGKDGAYPSLSDKERAERIDKAEKHIHRNKILNVQNQSKNQSANEKALLLSKDTQPIDENELKKLYLAEGIGKEFGNKYIQKMYSVPAEKTDYLSYNKIRIKQLMGKKDKEINLSILDDIDKLTLEDRTNLTNIPAYDPLDKKTMTIRASAQALYEWAYKTLDNNADIANEVVYNYFTRTDKDPNANIDEVMKEIQKDYIKKYYPGTTLLNDVPNIIGNRNKIRSVYKKESKTKGKKAKIKPLDTMRQSTEIGFDDL